MTVPVAFDLEGPIVNPGVDFAKDVYDSLISPGTKSKYPDPFADFDSYDDDRWRAERYSTGRKHSTGTTPLVVDCLAAVDGKTDDDMIEFASSIVSSGKAYNPGARELLRSLVSGSVYIITSSYPAIPIAVAEENGISFAHVFNHGNQVRNGMLDARGEIEHRSPLRVLSAHRDELAGFLYRYLDACATYRAAIGSGKKSEIRAAKENHDRIFSEIESPNLRSELAYIFLFEDGIMGGHGKAEAARTIAPDRRIVTVGDGIVDADMLAHSYFGIAINCTNTEALRASRLNVVTERWEPLIDLFHDLQGEKAPAPLTCRRNGIEIFTPANIENETAGVVAANKAAKMKLKSAYQTAPV